MKMIIGGAFQNKENFAIDKYLINKDEIINGNDVNIDNLQNIICIKNFHLLIKRILEKNICINDFVIKFYIENKNAIVISDEIGLGIVPLTKEDRIYREEVGRACTYLAGKSEEVIRVVSGIGIKIK